MPHHPVARYFHELLATFSIFLNALIGSTKREPLCSRLHRAREAGHWVQHLHLPRWFLEHCRWSASAD